MSYTALGTRHAYVSLTFHVCSLTCPRVRATNEQRLRNMLYVQYEILLLVLSTHHTKVKYRSDPKSNLMVRGKGLRAIHMEDCGLTS